jgi:hypothetical protein
VDAAPRLCSNRRTEVAKRLAATPVSTALSCREDEPVPIDSPLYLLVHVLLSITGFVTGLVVVGGLIAGVRFARWSAVFLVTTLLTSVTGFGFPFVKLLPSHLVGALSLVVLSGAFVALYGMKLAGAWRSGFVVLSVVALYLNVFVLMAQLLQKVPALAALAPGPQAPAFGATQGFVLALFVVLGYAARRGFGHALPARR